MDYGLIHNNKQKRGTVSIRNGVTFFTFKIT